MGRRAAVDWEQNHEALTLLVKLRKSGNTYTEIAEEINKKYNIDVSENIVRHTYNKHSKDIIIETGDLQEEVLESIEMKEINDYNESHEILKDGSQKSDKLITMSEEQQKDPIYLLEAHGFDPDKWELVTAKNNMWHVYSTEDGQQVSYSSKITVKPYVHQFSYEEFVDHIRNSKPIKINMKKAKVDHRRMLEIALYDMHFPISDYEYYRPTQSRINDKIISNDWKEVLFVIGSDLFHNDDFRGRTASGREIQEVDMEKAWDDARTFYEPLIRQAIDTAKRVKVMFIKGNHDESMSWAFVQMLKARFPQIEFDDSFQERKIHTFENVFIGLTHGDKAKKNLQNVFPAEFPVEWSNATCREIHTGHFHVEDAKDYFGMMIRTLATRNKTDKWHKDNGYVGAHKRFQLFEYSSTDLECIHYV